MTVDSEKVGLYLHPDLVGKDQSVDTNRFCIPIYITDGFGVNLKKEADLISARGAQPEIRSGTLTLISHEGQVYGLTCRHVVEALEKAEAVAHERLVSSVGDFPAPPFGHRAFRFPTLKEQIHINARFYKAPKDAFTGEGKDLAIARIPLDTFAKIGREAIPFDRIAMPPPNASHSLCGVATGFPEQNRTSQRTDGMTFKLSMPTVTATARFDVINESALRLYDEIGHVQEANNLSGMSGGPILWSDITGWGLAGLVKSGKDISPSEKAEGVAPIFEVPVVLIDGEPLTRNLLVDLIATIPSDDPPIPYYAVSLAVVNQTRQG